MPNHWRKHASDPRPGITPMLNEGPAHDALALHLQRQREAEGNRPTADDTRFRGSMAGECARKIAFQIMEYPPQLDLETSTLVAFDIGQSYHEVIQAGMVEHLGAELEVVCTHKPRLSLSSHADAVYDETAVEIKSMKAFAWSLAVEGNGYEHRGPGPKPEHLIQAGISAMANDVHAKRVHMIYVCKDTGELAEWIIGMDEPLIHLGGPPFPTVRELALAEMLRFAHIDEDMAAGNMPARDVPGYGLVDHRPPAAGSKDKPWNCRYCAYQPVCKSQPHGAFPIEEVKWPTTTTRSS